MQTIPSSVRNLVGVYHHLLDERFGSRLVGVRLFGLYARGDADDDSDVDVSVVIVGLTEPERTEAVDLALEASRRQDDYALLSPLVWSPEELEDRVHAERRIALDILTEGIPL